MKKFISVTLCVLMALATMTTLTGLVVVLMMVVQEIARLFELVKALFHL